MKTYHMMHLSNRQIDDLKAENDVLKQKVTEKEMLVSQLRREINKLTWTKRKVEAEKEEIEKEFRLENFALKSFCTAVVNVVKKKWLPYMSYDESYEYLKKEILNVYEEKDPIGSLTSDARAHISFEKMSALNNPYLVKSLSK